MSGEKSGHPSSGHGNAGHSSSEHTKDGRPNTLAWAAEIDDLSAGYPGVRALQGVSARLPAGGITALLGANGSGKSTLFACLLGLQPVETGRVQILGTTPSRARRKNLISYVPQQDGIDPHFPITVEQVVLMGRYRHMGFTRRARSADRDATDRALERVGLTDLRKRSIGELSGGQRRRALLARAIAQGAPLMLLDEPFAGVDRGSEQVISTQLRELRDAGTSMLISTHHLEGVPELADHVVLLHRSVLASGTPAQVLTDEHLARAFGAALAPGHLPGTEDPL